MKINLKLVLIIIFSLLIIVYLAIYASNKPSFISTTNNSSSNLKPSNNNYLNVTPSPITDYNNSMAIPPNEYMINNINWSSYPDIQTGYVHLAQVCEPNDIIPHKYLAIGIMTEVKNGDNRSLIYEQLGGIAQDVRRMSGPNSAITIFGTDHGVVAWTVTMRVYDDKIYY